MPIQAYYLAPDGKIHVGLSAAQIARAYKSKEGLLWVDISETTEEDAKFLKQQFHFHHLAIEDCVSPDIHPPKIDDFGDHIFIVVHGIHHRSEEEVIETAELGLFLAENFVVSNHNFPLYSIESVQHLVEEDGRPIKHGPDFMAYSLIDALIDNVLPAIDNMSDIASEIEEQVIRHPQPATLDGIIKLKRSTLRVHRVMAPQRDVVNRLSRGEFPLIKKEAQIYYRDIYDHVVRIEDLNQMTRDRADNVLATYLSAVANRQNETMRVLSVVATIFLPLTLLAGIYGMNFDYMPELHWRWGYFSVLGVILIVVLIVFWRFWASGWFAWGKRHITKVRPFAVNGKRLRGYNTPRKQKKL